MRPALNAFVIVNFEKKIPFHSGIEYLFSRMSEDARKIQSLHMRR
jgi:hypothetical protein